MQRENLIIILVFLLINLIPAEAFPTNESPNKAHLPEFHSFDQINLLGIKIGSSSDNVMRQLLNKYSDKLIQEEFDKSGIDGSVYIDKIDVLADESLGQTIDRWKILFTDPKVGGSAVYMYRLVVPKQFLNVNDMISDLKNKFGSPSYMHKYTDSRKLIKLRWHYTANGELMDALPDNRKCKSVHTERLSIRNGCDGKDVDVEIATMGDGDLLKSLSIAIRDHDLEKLSLKTAEIEAEKVEKDVLEAKKQESRKNRATL